MSFAGFPPEALRFYEGLAADNSKAYWERHRDVYEDAIREPMELLVHDLVAEFGGAKIFRPYRDVRFSKDKTPYKTHQGAVFTADRGTGSRYVEISANGLRLGGGRWHLEREELAKVRRAIDHDLHGKQLEQIKTALEDDGLQYAAAELKTAPKGYPKDHPRIELLRRKRHAAIASPGTPAWLHQAEAKDHIAETFRRVEPLIAWLEKHTG